MNVRRLMPLLLVLILPLAAGAQDEKKKPPRILIPVEEFLPGDTIAFLSLPDAKTALDVLLRYGEDRKALAARLAERAGVSPSSVSAQLEMLAAAADGPVTVSLHREFVARQGWRTRILATAATTVGGDAYRERGEGLLVKVLLPLLKGELVLERLMGLETLHIKADGLDVYHVATRGFLLYSTSALLLGRVLKEMQSPSLATLKYSEDYRSARKLAGASKRDGFLMVRDLSVLPVPKAAGVDLVAGSLVRDGSGFRDKVHLVPEKEGILSHLATGAAVPAAWADSHGKGAWLGAALDPKGVEILVLSLMDPSCAPQAAFLAEAAAGPVEVIFRAEGPPVFRIPLREGVDVEAAVTPLGDLAKLKDGVLLLCESPGGLAGRAGGPGKPWAGSGAAVVKAPASFLLSLFGRESAPAAAGTAWTFTVAEGGVRVTCGRSEVGIFQTIAASLFR